MSGLILQCGTCMKGINLDTALSSACDFKVIFANSMDPDQTLGAV